MSAQQSHAFVIGGSSGIGLATARRLSADGLRVTIAGRDPAKLAAAAAEAGGTLVTVVLDASDPASVAAAFEQVGSFDHLVLALGGSQGVLGPFAELDLATFRQAFEGKFWAHLACAQAALPQLRRDGSMTFVSAVSARMATPGLAGVAAINGAIETVARILAAELKPLRVNAVSPGLIDTPWWDFLPQDQKQATFAAYAEKIPVGRPGRAEEVAAAIAFVIGNGYMTGHTLVCDGGISLGT
ncbi:SDR family oxidoreductase [Inquilinus sp. YAF38]|uniref:SDR family oxidoreductase n=1 Tax=Inquilinus sp. YAF38 TaxID=3233084 RepID=UPI003F8EFB9D